MNAPAISARCMAAGKGRADVFSDLSFDVGRATFTALVGTNGSGKTTLFETLLGLVRLRRGVVRLLGRSPAAVRAEVAYLAQSSNLSCDDAFIGREFVAAAYRGHHWGWNWRRRDATRAVDHALDQVDALNLAGRRLGELSGGQRQRLLIAQALVNQPQLLLMDEPLAQLDPLAQQHIVALTAHLRDALGMAVVLSTHDINAVADTADRVLYLAGGRGCEGSIDEVVNDATLTALYGLPMHVVRERGQRFVMRDDGAHQLSSTCNYTSIVGTQRA